jgi:hypothetical protein
MDDIKDWAVKIGIPALVTVSMKLAIDFKRGTVTKFNVVASFVTGVGSAYLFSELIIDVVSKPYVPLAIAAVTISGEKIGYWLVYKFNIETFFVSFLDYLKDKVTGK